MSDRRILSQVVAVGKTEELDAETFPAGWGRDAEGKVFGTRVTLRPQGGDVEEVAYLSAMHPSYQLARRILSTLGRLQRPAMVSLSGFPGLASVVTKVQITFVGKVLDLDQVAGGDMLVEMDAASQRFELPRSAHNYAELRDLLREAYEHDSTVAITVDDPGVTIEDVRLAPGMVYRPVAGCTPTVFDAGAVSRLNATELQQCWNAIDITRCPNPVTPGCVPFAYPDNGCFAKAHAMCQVARGLGFVPAKVWIRGYLRIKTSNHPSCEFGWLWHVAMCVRPAVGNDYDDYLVFDPTGFDRPIRLGDWRRSFGTSKARYKLTSDDTYLDVYESSGWADGRCEGYGAAAGRRECDDDLDYYRLWLETRNPPYAKC